MMLSSPSGGCSLEEAALAQERPEHVGAAA